MSRRPLTWLLPVLAAALCYQGTLDAGFAFDDPVAVIDNPLVDGRLPAVEALSRSFWGDRPGFEHLASWRPLTVWSLRLDHVLGGGEPGAFHTTNLLLLLALVFAVVRLGLRWGLSPWGAGMAVSYTHLTLPTKA